MIDRAFKELHWARDTEITARHLLNINLGTQDTHYHKSLEQYIKEDAGIGWEQSSLASKVSAKQAKEGNQVPFPPAKDNSFDLLWLGHID